VFQHATGVKVEFAFSDVPWDSRDEGRVVLQLRDNGIGAGGLVAGIMRLAGRNPRSHGQQRLSAVKGLDLTLFIRKQYKSFVRSIGRRTVQRCIYNLLDFALDVAHL